MTTEIQENDSFGRGLRSERHRLGLTQAYLAEVGGVSKTSQVAYESGASYPDSRYLGRVALLGVDITRLLTGRQPASEQWDLSEELSELIEEWASQRGRPTPVAEKCGLLRNLYDQFRATREVRADQVAATFKLVR